LIRVDKERIKQVILNRCKNAAEAMPGGGVLTCKAYQLNDQVILEISDTGIGIPDGIDVFQLFKTTKADGTGLGLPIVQQIISEHRGTIEYVSEAEKAPHLEYRCLCTREEFNCTANALDCGIVQSRMKEGKIFRIVWWRWTDSNCRLRGYEPRAIPLSSFKH
jgi:signal transduction histidine kinase